MTEEDIAEAAAAMLDRPGGMMVLDQALMRKGFMLCAYLTPHQHHQLDHEIHSDCPECMAAASRQQGL